MLISLIMVHTTKCTIYLFKLKKVKKNSFSTHRDYNLAGEQILNKSQNIIMGTQVLLCFHLCSLS